MACLPAGGRQQIFLPRQAGNRLAAGQVLHFKAIFGGMANFLPMSWVIFPSEKMLHSPGVLPDWNPVWLKNLQKKHVSRTQLS